MNRRWWKMRALKDAVSHQPITDADSFLRASVFLVMQRTFPKVGRAMLFTNYVDMIMCVRHMDIKTELRIVVSEMVNNFGVFTKYSLCRLYLYQLRIRLQHNLTVFNIFSWKWSCICQAVVWFWLVLGGSPSQVIAFCLSSGISLENTFFYNIIFTPPLLSIWIYCHYIAAKTLLVKCYVRLNPRRGWTALFFLSF